MSLSTAPTVSFKDYCLQITGHFGKDTTVDTGNEARRQHRLVVGVVRNVVRRKMYFSGKRCHIANGDQSQIDQTAVRIARHIIGRL